MIVQRPDLLGSEQFPPEPKQARSRQKREALLAAAQALFGELGYEAVSVGQIAARAGVAVGAFYQHFASKRQLVMILMDQLLSHVAALTAQAQPARVDPRTAIEGLVRQGLQLDWAYAGAYRAWREAAVQEPALRALSQQIEAWSANQIYMLFTALHQFPGARPTVDLQLMAHTINLLFWQLIERPTHDPAQAEAVVATMTDLIYHSLFHDAP